MRLGNFAVEIPQGKEGPSGYITIKHNTKYTIQLINFGYPRCDAKIKIDGKSVGVWRIMSREYDHIERPIHDTGCFTFYQFGTYEAEKAGLTQSEDLGLISVLFKPDKERRNTRWCRFNMGNTELSRKGKLGGTGLSGKSEQKFCKAPMLNYDKTGYVQIYLRLVCEMLGGDEEPRPLPPMPPVIIVR